MGRNKGYVRTERSIEPLTIRKHALKDSGTYNLNELLNWSDIQTFGSKNSARCQKLIEVTLDFQINLNVLGLFHVLVTGHQLV
jgi:hypothetical protein